MEIKSWARFTLAAAALVAAGCRDEGGQGAGPGSTAPQANAPDAGPPAADASTLPARGFIDPTLANASGTPAPANEGLQYSGAVALYRTIMPTQPGPSDAATEPGRGQWLEISAPIWPKVFTLYQGQGSDYPTTPQGEAKLAHDSALTFDTLLRECQPLYPGIALWAAGDPPLLDAQVATNYDLLAQ
jgi:hypothetical protein